ncbi:putative peptidoglycan binding domain protein [Enhygromyxa salina]|uniref:Putative peptidoglycan binding domain protein n=1 Tax=Enhygromyxa salina TaxID=215803 RepID=A0A2S9XFB3_9BACT|nr:LysM domain-containing protein [Enhygromyxa salina]PRP91450.1 putative peptidoglycan binding domain protein [Enhygromyxa salina]
MATSYRVRQGECISSIAHRHGLFPDDLWQAPDNAELRAARRNPNSLAPGDVIVIPDREPKQAKLALDSSHTFKIKGVPAKLSVLVSDDGEALADRAYTLTVDGVRHEGATDSDGKVEVWVAPGSRRALLEVEVEADDIWEYELELGGLDAVETIRGAQARLTNLGYGCPSSGQLDDDTRAALEAFQADHEVSVSGELDEPTIAALAEHHDS